MVNAIFHGHDSEGARSVFRWREHNRLRRLTQTYRNIPGPHWRVPRYKPQLIDCDLCGSSIAECRKYGLPVASTYHLHVHPHQVYSVTCMIAAWTGRDPNPLAPLLLLVPDNQLLLYEWFVEADGVAVGSRGC